MPARFRILAGVGVLAILILTTVWFLSSLDGADSAAPETVGPVEPYLRLALSRDSSTGAVDITRATMVESAVRPLTGMGGYYAVLDGGDDVLTASPFACPTHEVDEYRDVEGAMVLAREVELTRPSVWGSGWRWPCRLAMTASLASGWDGPWQRPSRRALQRRPLVPWNRDLSPGARRPATAVREN